MNEKIMKKQTNILRKVVAITVFLSLTLTYAQNTPRAIILQTPSYPTPAITDVEKECCGLYLYKKDFEQKMKTLAAKCDVIRKEQLANIQNIDINKAQQQLQQQQQAQAAKEDPFLQLYGVTKEEFAKLTKEQQTKLANDNFKKKYGVTPEEYKKLSKEQQQEVAMKALHNSNIKPVTVEEAQKSQQLAQGVKELSEANNRRTSYYKNLGEMLRLCNADYDEIKAQCDVIDVKYEADREAMSKSYKFNPCGAYGVGEDTEDGQLAKQLEALLKTTRPKWAQSYLSQEEAKYKLIVAYISKAQGRLKSLLDEAETVDATFADMIYKSGIDAQDIQNRTSACAIELSAIYLRTSNFEKEDYRQYSAMGGVNIYK